MVAINIPENKFDSIFARRARSRRDVLFERMVLIGSKLNVQRHFQGNIRHQIPA